VKNVRNLAMEKGKLAEASEEGQGLRSAVEPMMMMNTIVPKLGAVSPRSAPVVSHGYREFL
jgi:hypothetical protein